MTYNDLIAQVADTEGDSSGEFSADVLRWINFVRSDIAQETSWACATVANATFDTVASTGFYALNDGTNDYEHLVGDQLYDETNDWAIRHESYAMQNQIDPSKQVTGPPAWWGDAGVNANGVRQIYLWPIPDGVYTIRFAGVKVLGDVNESELAESVDSYFGPITPWGACFATGLRYYRDLDNDEDQAAINSSYTMFRRQIALRKQTNRASRTSTLPGHGSRVRHSVTGARFNPAHFSNR